MSRPNSMLYPTKDNSFANTSPYPGHTAGIDLRVELDDLLNTYGHWVMVRKYDTTTHSEYWDDELRESRGGAPWVYTDYVVRARKVIQRSGGVLSALEMPAPPGMLTIPYANYYLKWDAAGTIGNADEIYEFPWDSDANPEPSQAVLICERKYNILESVDLLGDAGRREYYLCICRLDELGW